jgi:hypothetical protein
VKILVAVLFTLVLSLPALTQGPRIVTGAEANGTYRSGRNEIKILALGNNKLRVQMHLTYEYKSQKYGPMANVGEAFGEATIENDTATFNPPNTEDCTITIKFLPRNRLKVSEDHTMNCGFGLNVSSEGTYSKIKGGKPKFDSDN